MKPESITSEICSICSLETSGCVKTSVLPFADSIEANVESSEVHVERATEQLQRAAYYQKKSRKKMCILVLVLSVVIVILGLIIWLVYRTK